MCCCSESRKDLTGSNVHDKVNMYIIKRGSIQVIRYKHLRLDQDKIGRAKRILKAKTETEAIDKALEKVVEENRERLRRRNLFKRIIELRNRIGKVQEDSAGWVRTARKERTLFNDRGA